MNEHHHKYFSVDMKFDDYFFTMEREPLTWSVVKNSWNWNFCWFQRLYQSFYQWQPPKEQKKKGCSENFCNIHRKTPIPESLLRPQPYLKKALAHGFSCEFCKIFENNFFTKHLWMTASILQQLLAL